MQQTVSNFLDKHNLHTNEEVRYIDLVSEVGELGKELLSATNYGKKEYQQPPTAAEELGDCLFSLFALCCEMNVDAEKALQGAIAKYEIRITEKGDIGSC